MLIMLCQRVGIHAQEIQRSPLAKTNVFQWNTVLRQVNLVAQQVSVSKEQVRTWFEALPHRETALKTPTNDSLTVVLTFDCHQ